MKSKPAEVLAVAKVVDAKDDSGESESDDRAEGEVWHLIAPIFAKSPEDQSPDIDMVLWKQTHMAADKLIWDKRTESNYGEGPGACGKDVLIMLATYFRGNRADDGFLTVFLADHFTRKHKPSAGLDPVLDIAKNARLVVVNEVIVCFMIGVVIVVLW